MFTGEEQSAIRNAMFMWLDVQTQFKPWLTRSELRNGFVWHGTLIALMDSRKGIWNPKDFDETVSITSTLNGPYEDFKSDSDDLLNYKYQNAKNGAGTNTKLRAAFTKQVPIILFEEFEDGKYIPRYPVFVSNDFFEKQTFQVDLSGISIQSEESITFSEEPIEKSYAERLTMQRIHQPRFRARVIRAYDEKCAICRLKHVELLDAAHIIPDAHENGYASVTNGLSLCKIHHAAYDRNVIGISPDYKVQIKESVMLETDGPMLEYGIKKMNGVSITLPRNNANLPLRENLDQRFQQFLANSTG